MSGAPNTIEVSLTEFKIDMPTTLSAGPVVFVAKNDGNYKHSLKIEGQGIEQRLDADLPAGAEGKLQVELAPGTYRGYGPGCSQLALVVDRLSGGAGWLVSAGSHHHPGRGEP